MITYATMVDCLVAFIFVPMTLKYNVAIWWNLFQSVFFIGILYLLVPYTKKLQNKYNVGLAGVSKLNIRFEKSRLSVTNINSTSVSLSPQHSSFKRGSINTVTKNCNDKNHRKLSVNNNNNNKNNNNKNKADSEDENMNGLGDTNIGNLREIQHWSQIIVTPLGYQLFINHLQQEFSVENLLFLTEVCFRFGFCFNFVWYQTIL